MPNFDRFGFGTSETLIFSRPGIFGSERFDGLQTWALNFTLLGPAAIAAPRQLHQHRTDSHCRSPLAFAPLRPTDWTVSDRRPSSTTAHVRRRSVQRPRVRISPTYDVKNSRHAGHHFSLA